MDVTSREIRVLYVDGDTQSAERTITFLEREHDRFGIETATSASDVLEKLKSDAFDCLVSKYDIPDANGIELLDTVRSKYPELPFILFTGNGSEAVAAAALSSGATEYVQKQEDASRYTVLANRIENAVAQYRAHRKVERANRRREELHTIILELSSNLISGDENEIDERIQHGLKRIGEFEQADRSYVFQIRADGARMDNTHEWCAPGIDSQKPELQNLRTEQFSWFMPKVNSRETVTVPDVSELPPEARVLRQTLESGDVESIVTIPLVRGGTVLGFLGLDWTETRASWSDEMVGLLEASATIIANALTRKETVAERKEREQTLSALHNAATEIGRAETEATVYETLIETAERLFEFDLVAIDIEHDGYLIQEAWKVEDGGYYEKTSLEESDTFAVQAYNRQETILVDDLREFDVVPADSRYRSALTVPIGTFGTFQTVSNAVGAFDEYDREFTELLVDHARVKLTQLQDKQRLRERTADLERKNERLDTFAGLVSHDLRNPLNTLDLSLQLARQTGESEHFERCQRAVDRMDQLLEDLLTLARQGQEIDACEPVVLEAAVEEAWETVETRDGELHVNVERTLDADRTRLRQLLENLIHNATTHGGDTVRVTVGPLPDGFYVADDGTGIPESERETVFETGYSTADEGTGFGLAIVQEIADAHGWNVTVTESNGGGARFEITGIAWT